MIETIAMLIFFIIVIAACCSADSGSTNTKSQPKRSPPVRRNVTYHHDDYCECPSCGSPYYDGYCEECGYPDVNQGWLGEEYG